MSGKFMMNGIEYLGGGSGGGGGNVNDVYVNGESVLDGNKIAQVTSYKEVTLAEYMALPDTKLTDGIMYCIKDVGGANQFPPLIYSDEEREVGVWRDGKPLYQKTLTVNIVNKVQWIETNIDTNSLIVDAKGVLVTPDLTNGLIILPSGDPSGLVGIGTIFKDVISVGTFSLLYRADSNSLGSGTAYITIWYTKGSDTPGSGTWTTDGTYAKHYSTEEKVIGTWIDGKPLYEQAFSKTLSGSPDSGGDSFIIAENITYIDTLVNMSGTVKKSNFYAFCSETGLIPTVGWSYSFHLKSNGQLVAWTSNNSSCYSEIAGGKAVAILQYTKTTD